jgi:GDP-mannose transporter
VCVEVCRLLEFVEYPPLTRQTAREWAPVNIFFCLMLFTGMSSLETNSVPMVTVFKNVTNIITAAGDLFFFGGRPEPLALAAFAVMLLGAVAAARNDMYVTTTGLFWMVANCMSTSGYVLYMKFATKHIKMSKFGMVYVNNLLCIAFLLPVAFTMGEVSTFLKTEGIHSFEYAVKNAFAGFVGFFLNFASLNCVSVTGPSTYAIVGSLNKVPVAIIGYLLFDNEISGQTWFFIGVSMFGGFLYSYAQIRSAGRNRGAK